MAPKPKPIASSKDNGRVIQARPLLDWFVRTITAGFGVG